MSFELCEKNGVPFYRSTLLPCPHAFSVRGGGVSSAEHLRSMNIGENRGDDPENVKKNISLLCGAAGLPDKVISACQVHSADVTYVDRVPQKKPSLDGFYTDVKGLTLCVKIADCLPVLMYDGERGCVAALHAGWRGSAMGIVRQGVEKLVFLGARRENILCAVGPGIGPCCFEVKEDFVASFTELAGREAAEKYIEERSGRLFADLKRLNKDLLLRSGVREEHIDVSPACTCCRPDLFFSHRATGGLRGTMGAMISL